MHISAPTLDDLLKRVFESLLQARNRVQSTRGESRERIGVSLRLKNPRARLSHTERRGKIFSALGEWLWYLSRTNDLRFVSYYIPRYTEDSDDGETLYGAYGPRMFAMRGNNQLQNVIDLLKRNPGTRRAVIQLFNAEDIATKHKEIPCTCSMQFMVRRSRLEMVTYMRSNDAFLGLPHDVFAFTMLQELIARSLNIEIGEYRHLVGSLHLYADDARRAHQYVNEGWQPIESAAMPPMPLGDPWHSIGVLLNAEKAIRSGATIDARKLTFAAYWKDLVRLLQIYALSGKAAAITRLKGQMHSPVFSTFISQRKSANPPVRTLPRQLELPLLFDDE